MGILAKLKSTKKSIDKAQQKRRAAASRNEAYKLARLTAAVQREKLKSDLLVERARARTATANAQVAVKRSKANLVAARRAAGEVVPTQRAALDFGKRVGKNVWGEMTGRDKKRAATPQNIEKWLWG